DQLAGRPGGERGRHGQRPDRRRRSPEERATGEERRPVHGGSSSVRGTKLSREGHRPVSQNHTSGQRVIKRSRVSTSRTVLAETREEIMANRFPTSSSASNRGKSSLPAAPNLSSRILVTTMRAPCRYPCSNALS